MENQIEIVDFEESNFCPLQIFNNNNVVIETFNSNQNLEYQKENSRIKQNQIGIIKKLGCIFVFNYEKIIFIDNENMGLLLNKIYNEEKNEEIGCFKINDRNLFILNFSFPIINVYLDNKEDNIFVFQSDDNNKKTIVQSFVISNLMNGNSSVNSSVILEFEIMNAILFDTNFYILNSNKDLLLFDLHLNQINQISQNVENFNVNNYNFSLIYNTNNRLFIKTNNSSINFELSQIFNFDEEEIIFLDNINNLIIIYTISKTNREKNDKLYIIQLDENNAIIKIYLDKDIFYPDEYENDGISINSLQKRAILTTYDENYNLYFVCNKQGNQIEKIYLFEEDEEPKIFHLDDDKKITSLNKTAGENNTFTGICKIDFEFNRYEGQKETINGVEFRKPSLFVSCGYLGGINLYYLPSENSIKLISRSEFESYKFPNLNSNIVVDYENENNINNENIIPENNNENINNLSYNNNNEVIEKEIKEEDKKIDNKLNKDEGKKEEEEKYEVNFMNPNDNEIDTSSSNKKDSNKPQKVEINHNIINKNPIENINPYIKIENTEDLNKQNNVKKYNENENNKSNINNSEENNNNNNKGKVYNNFSNLSDQNKNDISNIQKEKIKEEEKEKEDTIFTLDEEIRKAEETKKKM